MDPQLQKQNIPPQPVLTTPQPSLQKSKKGLIIGIVVAVLVLVGGLGWWFAQNAQNKYAKDAVTYEEHIKEAFLYYKNSTDIDNHLGEIRNKMDNALAFEPIQPNLLGIPLPVQGSLKERVTLLTTSFQALRDGFTDYHNFNAFAQRCLALLNKLEKTPPTLDMQGVDKLYRTAADDLRDLRGPNGVTDFKNKKADTLLAIADQASKAEKAYKDSDAEAYKAADQQISTLQQQVSVTIVTDELQKMYRTFYDDLSKKYDEAAKTLGIEG